MEVLNPIMMKRKEHYIEEIITTSGTWTFPEGVSEVFIIAVGGGGGGGKASGTTGNSTSGIPNILLARGSGGGAGGIQAGLFIGLPEKTRINISIGEGGDFAKAGTQTTVIRNDNGIFPYITSGSSSAIQLIASGGVAGGNASTGTTIAQGGSPSTNSASNGGGGGAIHLGAGVGTSDANIRVWGGNGGTSTYGAGGGGGSAKLIALGGFYNAVPNIQNGKGGAAIQYVGGQGGNGSIGVYRMKDSSPFSFSIFDGKYTIQSGVSQNPIAVTPAGAFLSACDKSDTVNVFVNPGSLVLNRSPQTIPHTYWGEWVVKNNDVSPLDCGASGPGIGNGYAKGTVGGCGGGGIQGEASLGGELRYVMDKIFVELCGSGGAGGSLIGVGGRGGSLRHQSSFPYGIAGGGGGGASFGDGGKGNINDNLVISMKGTYGGGGGGGSAAPYIKYGNEYPSSYTLYPAGRGADGCVVLRYFKEG